MTPEELLRGQLARQRLRPGRYRISLGVEVSDGRGRMRPGPHPIGWIDVSSSGDVQVRLVSTNPADEARALLQDDLLDVVLVADAIHLVAFGPEHRAASGPPSWREALPVATARLVDKRTRVVEVVGPMPPGSRRPELLLQPWGPDRPRHIGSCIGISDRRAKFLVDEGRAGDEFLDLLASGKAPVRSARLYGIKGYLIEG